jgi:hypothetical protein
MKSKFSFILLIAFLFCELGAVSAQMKTPSFEEVISLEGVGGPVMSADGRSIAFTATKADWESNRFDTEIWISRELLQGLRDQGFQVS